MTTRINASKHLVIVMLWAIGPTVAAAQNDLQSLITRAEDKNEVSIASGTYQSPITIDRAFILRGESREKCVLEVTADEPAITVSATKPVTIESMTIKWQLATSEGRKGAAGAVFVQDGSVTMRNCRVIASGNNQRCPAAVACAGFSKVKLENCRFEGFEFTIGYGGGSEGTITDCVILDPGHCGITVYSGSKIDVARNIITGSRYHGVRCTGGTLTAHDNLIIRNKNRGIYLGNKSASGRVSNNVILGNGTGISAFAQTDVTIENNLILNSSFAGLGTRDSCPLTVRNNVFQENTRGIVIFEEFGRNRVTFGQNSFWKNETDTENVERPPNSIFVDPRFEAPERGDFSLQAGELKANDQGLSDPLVFGSLWEKWNALADRPTEFETEGPTAQVTAVEPRIKISEVLPEMLQGPQLSFQARSDRGNQYTWVYRHFAEFAPSLRATSVFGRPDGPGNDVGFSMSEPRELQPGQGAVMIRCRSADGNEERLAVDLTQCVSAEWIAPEPDTIEATYVLKNGPVQCELVRTATLVRFPEVPGGVFIKEQFRLVQADEGLEVVEFSEYIEADDEIRVAHEPAPPIGLMLLCLDRNHREPAFAQVFLGKGWGLGKSQQSGMDLVKEMRLVTRTLPKPCRLGVIAESCYVVATKTDPQSAREQLISSAGAVATGRATRPEPE